MFKELEDKFGNTFFSLDLANHSSIVNAPIERDGAVFERQIPVVLRATGLFSTDLTARDDVILAFLSLMFLLVVEGTVTSFLLSRRNGYLSNFGFSVKYIIDLVQDYNAHRVFRGNGHKKSRKRVNARLILFAILILVTTFGLEVGVLFLTNPIWRDVTNSEATFRIRQPVAPNWDTVRFHFRASLNKPCGAMTLARAQQGLTRIVTCTTTSVPDSSLGLFQTSVEEIGMTLVSDIHDYGAEHFVAVGDLNSTFSTRIFFNLGDRRQRLMKSGSNQKLEQETARVVHKQYVAFLFSIYARATKDKAMDLTRLNSLSFTAESARRGPVIELIKVKGKPVTTNSTRYTTTVKKGVIPSGYPALRVAQVLFRGSFAVAVHESDEEDLFINDGMAFSKTAVWSEKARVINWLSMLIMLVASLLVLVLVRVVMKPVSIAEIAEAMQRMQSGERFGEYRFI